MSYVSRLLALYSCSFYIGPLVLFAGSNPAGGEILPEPKRRFIAQSLSCSPFHRLEMTEILLNGYKTLTHPSIHWSCIAHLSAEDMLKSAVIQEKKFQNIESE